MRFRVLHLSDTPWFRTVHAPTAWQAAETILAHPMTRVLAMHQHDFEGDRAVTYCLSDTWVTVIHA